MKRTLLELMGVHESLRERFAEHRDLVVGLEFGKALESLEVFERELVDHMRAEEKHILPLYERRVGRIPGGDPQFFHLEHRNLLRNLSALKEALGRLAGDRGAGRRQAHEFLHREALFLHLLEHHDGREKNILYPSLDRVLTDGEREALLAVCGAQAKRGSSGP
ncbi:MAG TPA: hemerythrin domain-containing protein [Planctomycetota bacterium]|nr:hemerythrin domain-containing protein [Planctomycetota bacterium]